MASFRLIVVSATLVLIEWCRRQISGPEILDTVRLIGIFLIVYYEWVDNTYTRFLWNRDSSSFEDGTTTALDENEKTDPQLEIVLMDIDVDLPGTLLKPLNPRPTSSESLPDDVSTPSVEMRAYHALDAVPV